MINYFLLLVDLDFGGGKIFFEFDDIIYVIDEVYYLVYIIWDFLFVVVIIKGIIDWFDKFVKFVGKMVNVLVG